MGKIEELPPSYDEAISQSPTGQLPQYNNNQQHPPPPPPPNRPSSYSSSSHQIPQQQPQVRPTNSVPWQYPRGYWCSKCHNTGKKLKNGKSCNKCWKRFAPRNGATTVNTNVSTQYSYSSNSSNFGGFGLPFSSGSTNVGFTHGPQSYSYQTTTVNNMPPRFVKPGDPAIGGIMCGNCRGSGLVRFFLDEDLW